MSFLAALAAIVLHVVNYNVTAQIEYNTRIFTRLLGKHAIYYYAVYLVSSAAVRDHFIDQQLRADSNTFPVPLIGWLPLLTSWTLFLFGIGLNLWTLYTLGIKGMYNGDSFGFLFDAPRCKVTTGPYQYLEDPQYVGTAIAMFAAALYYQSVTGLYLTIFLMLVFYLSVKYVEGPHMHRIYSEKNKKK
ncbi:hypothetical protein PROFUN_11085 [Planoprotostelium fungivorum]|uniref:Phosphatidylethanolamine N-methyltransferase n=1 Tax=Planoprotostelium fungivorum TaxID=1890364 RepID=A0A2P6NAK1_9EUKA|nr:hypothetical protein PROFUN_11085 [Planoprotostelium fungivorum]